MSKVTMSKDGLSRMQVNVKTRLSLYDIAVLFTCGMMYSIPHEAKESVDSQANWIEKELKSRTNKQILEEVMNTILTMGWKFLITV